MMSGSSTWSTRAQSGSRRRGGTAAANQRAPNAITTLLGLRTQSTVARRGSTGRAGGVTRGQTAHRGEGRNRISLRFPEYCKEERLSTWSYKRVCIACDRTVYMGDDAVSSHQNVYHGNCLRCNRCHAPLQAREHKFHGGKLWCMPHYEQAVLSTYSGSQREGSRLARSSMSTYSGSRGEGSHLAWPSTSMYSGLQCEGSHLARSSISMYSGSQREGPRSVRSSMSTHSGSQHEGSRSVRSSISTHGGSQHEGSRSVRSSMSTHSESQHEGSRLDRDKSERQVNDKFAPNRVYGSPAPSSKRVGGESSSTVQRFLSKILTTLMAA